MLEYKIKELSETDEKPIDILSTPIESRGQVTTFTMNEIIGDSLLYDKQIKELTAEFDFEIAKVGNMEMHHPFLKDMEPVDLLACYLYAEAKARAKARIDMIEKINVQKKNLQEEIDGIVEQLPEFKDFSLDNETKENVPEEIDETPQPE